MVDEMEEIITKPDRMGELAEARKRAPVDYLDQLTAVTGKRTIRAGGDGTRGSGQ
jgi:hypothetical protein